MNHRVRVKLTEHGRRVHRQNYNDLVEWWRIRSGGRRPLPLDYDPPTEDADGWSQWQLWELAHDFGAHVGMGRDLPFETDIEIDPES